MMKAILYAFLAAVFYAINIPVSKVLLRDVGPTTMAALLYLGAGIGIALLSLLNTHDRKASAPLTRWDMPFVVGMIVLDIAAPIFLMLGIRYGTSANASLLGSFEIVATKGTRDALVAAGVPATLTLKYSEGRPNIIDLITNGDADLVINTPSNATKAIDDGSMMRRTAIKAHTAYRTTMAAGKAAAVGIKTVKELGSNTVKSLQEIHASIK